MEFFCQTNAISKTDLNCLILPVLDNAKLTPSGEEVNKLNKQHLKKIISNEGFKGKEGDILTITDTKISNIKKIVLVGFGDPSKLDTEKFKSIVQSAYKAVKDRNNETVHADLVEVPFGNKTLAYRIKQAIYAIHESNYKFDKFKSKPLEKEDKASTKSKIREWTFFINFKKDIKAIDEAIQQAVCISAGMQLTKDLGNTPPNICTPEFIAAAAESLDAEFKNISYAALEFEDMERLGMGAMLSVAQSGLGSPKLITLQYKPPKAKNLKNPIVLVGKGVTFDTGGNSLKPAQSMIGMKYDMCGAASVLGTIFAIAKMDLNLHVIGLAPCTENMPGPQASRPDDIVTSMSGKTIEILNTDAEGRLILCDTLTYAERFEPSAVIDIATLTGACVVALGKVYSGLMSNNKDLAKQLMEMGEASNDLCWELPLHEEYAKQLDSNVADMANITGTGEAGTITAACFLQKFADKFKWAHLDVAGTACSFTGKNRSATGRPVPLLVEYLISKTNKK